MISVPIVEAKNKLTFFIHLLEDNSQDAIEITKHGKAVVVLGKKDDFCIAQKENSFMLQYKNFRQKLTNELSQSEWESYFEIPRNSVNIRHPEDFE